MPTPTTLVTTNIWPRITSAARRSRGDVAVAYFGQGAGNLLPLKEGSTLVVDMSEGAVRSGQTCPKDIIELLKKGVRVFSVGNLHAKVFAFRDKAFIGSTNVSYSSARGLVEAAVETTNRQLISAMRRFVGTLAGEEITLKYAKQLLRIYRPPRFGRGGGKNRGGRKAVKRVTPIHSPVRIVHLDWITYSKEEKGVEQRETPKARKQIRDTRNYDVDSFSWEYGLPMKLNEMVIQVVDYGKRKIMVEPPARVIRIKQVPKVRPATHLIFLESPKKPLAKRLQSLWGRIDARAYRSLNSIGLEKNPDVAHELLNMWE